MIAWGRRRISSPSPVYVYYLSTMRQLMNALPKTLDPASRFTLRGHFARPGQSRLCHSMRAAKWFLLPSDGVFRRSSSSLQYYLTRQGRLEVLRGGDVTRPPLERHLNWVPDPAPTPPRKGKENQPPAAEPHKLPRKMRPVERGKNIIIIQAHLEARLESASHPDAR